MGRKLYWNFHRNKFTWNIHKMLSFVNIKEAIDINLKLISRYKQDRLDYVMETMSQLIFSQVVNCWTFLSLDTHFHFRPQNNFFSQILRLRQITITSTSTTTSFNLMKISLIFTENFLFYVFYFLWQLYVNNL